MSTEDTRPKLMSCRPLPAWRVSVIRDGERYPWTPPAPAPVPTFAEPVAIDYGKDPVIPAPRGTPVRKSVRMGVIAIRGNGRPVHYLSVTAAARASGVCSAEVKRQLRGLGKAPRMAYRFQRG